MLTEKGVCRKSDFSEINSNFAYERPVSQLPTLVSEHLRLSRFILAINSANRRKSSHRYATLLLQSTSSNFRRSPSTKHVKGNTLLNSIFPTASEWSGALPFSRATILFQPVRRRLSHAFKKYRSKCKTICVNITSSSTGVGTR